MRAALMLSLALLAGCGQAGDLYLPSPPPAQPETNTPPAPVTPAPAPVDKKDKK